MDILFVCTELMPFVKVGGLADVAAALPKALRALGHKVTVVLPRFPAIEEGGLLVARRLTPLKFQLGERAVEVTLFDGRLASQVDVILVDAQGLYDRRGVYGEGEDYPDNALRFATLSSAAAEIARSRAAGGQPYDIVFCNDWQTALVPTYIERLSKETSELGRTRSILVLHNVEHQGVFPKEELTNVGLPESAFNVDGLEFYGKLNLLKQGILSADAVTAVSPTYAREIVQPGGGHGLEGVLRARKEGVVGILNGIDYGVWNPTTDSAIAARYDAQDLAPKARCKGALQKELGLPIDLTAPLVVSVGRMVLQKGTDLVASFLPKLLRSTDAQLAIAGDGDVDMIMKIEHAVAKSSGRAVFTRAASEALVHRMFAGADLVIVPSRREPCGLVQLFAQRYGALPVARATGGIVDTVVDCDAQLETGTGFLFQDDTDDALLAATERGIAAMVHPRWPELMRRVMRLDRSWDGPARRYDQLMQKLMTR